MNSIIERTREYVEEKFRGDSSGHDWWHIYRVWKMAQHIANNEDGVDIQVVELAALMHDLGDWKLNTTEKSEEEIISDACRTLDVSKDDTSKILDIILHIPYNKNIEVKNELSLEGKIVQDADRLDAIGAIGIARVFAYGGMQNRELYNPDIKPQKIVSVEQYKKSQGSSVNHFYEKLLLVKDHMNTETAKAIAESRHQYMKHYLERFHKEWDGEM
jgi:uncharacterized protein